MCIQTFINLENLGISSCASLFCKSGRFRAHLPILIHFYFPTKESIYCFVIVSIHFRIMVRIYSSFSFLDDPFWKFTVISRYAALMLGVILNNSLQGIIITQIFLSFTIYTRTVDACAKQIRFLTIPPVVMLWCNNSINGSGSSWVDLDVEDADAESSCTFISCWCAILQIAHSILLFHTYLTTNFDMYDTVLSSFYTWGVREIRSGSPRKCSLAWVYSLSPYWLNVSTLCDKLCVH